MSSLCGEGPPPSRLVLHAPLTGSGAFMGKDSSIVWDGQLRGSHPLNPHGLPRGTAGRDPHTPSEFGRAQQALAHSPGPGGGSCSTGQLWDERSLLSAALVAVRAGPALPAHRSVWVGTLAKVLEKFGSRHQKSVLF